MATGTAQRVGIWIIAVAMIVGTLAGFAAMIFSSDNQQTASDAYNEYQKEYAVYQEKASAQNASIEERSDELSKKYAEVFVKQKELVEKFNKDDVKKLEIKTLKEGNGDKIEDNSTYITYYIGFNPTGKIFDSSLDGDKLKTPLTAAPNGLIAGWMEAMKGKKIGGIYELTIPSDKAYGEQGSGDDIPPNTPLKFIVMPIEMLETYEQPEVTQQVIEGYNGGQ